MHEWFGDPVEVEIRPVEFGPRNGRGDRTKTWPESKRFKQGGCAVAPRYSNESNERGYAERVIVGTSLYGPYDIKLGSDDRVFYDGHLYEVVGIVGRWRNPFDGSKPGSETALVEVTSNG